MENVMETMEKSVLEDEKLFNFDGPEDDDSDFDDDLDLEGLDLGGDDDFDDDDF
ncbi:hypothetical protein [Sphingobacterium populi]|uniref:hypothetical protein n=1 Tax=Sphingobacterium sp. CFCC 11742 TaxID=1775560 RepID=UPI000A9075DC|nr:hypothetical protein [Sphingobacterium sp. CFCC 11742]